MQIGAGELYQMAPLEATVCGTLPQNTSNTILKQGIQLGTYTTATFATPGSSGQSINYLIEAQYQDQDISLDPTTGNAAVVLQFYNSSNPQTPWSGPNNSGQTSNTFRDGIIAYQIKAGAAATTGTQTTPAPDSGYVGLWVVTVPFGASTLTSANISQYAGAPILPNSLLQSILTSNLTYGIDSGTANSIQATFPVPVSTLTDGMAVWVKVKNANTGATTFTPNPGVIAPSPVVGAAHAALQGGEYMAGGRALQVWRQDIGSWVLIECTGAAIQIAPATAPNHAVGLGQLFPSVSASVASNALTGTLIAPTALPFRNPTLTSGVPVAAAIPTNLSLTVPSGATLGTVSGQNARLVWLVAYNGGNPALCVVNLAGGVNLDETTLISTTAISSSANSGGVIYSASTITNSPFRVVGFCDITETTAGTWTTGPATVQGIGGEALASLSAFGAGQTVQSVGGSRAIGTTYTNSTARSIFVMANIGSSGVAVASAQLNALQIGAVSIPAGGFGSFQWLVPPGATYGIAVSSGGTLGINQWTEIR
ncbi:hypothetical protein PQR70_33695 [Paraburkholderia madseniana]|uniref:hypothetical protein n=1 Tax=Paraburkholderia madseniana TaxID=2599607 RepID=UPI0038B87F36